MRSFSGKKVFITGGSSGIGKACAKELLRAGASVVLAARGVERLEATVAELERAGGGRCFALPLDISDREAVAREAPKAIELLGGLDVLINNAGIARPGYLQDIEDELFEEMMQVNYFGTVWVTRALLPHFVAQRGGHICTVSSFAGLIGIFGYTAYAASKSALIGFCDCLRQEMLAHRVGVSIVFPADTKTPQLDYEEQFKPPETRAIAGNVKLMPPDQVARELLAGIAADRYHILPGSSTKFAHFMYRHFPWIVRWVMDSDLRKYQRKNS
jgi:3-dehydrosphinganine reductase